MVEVVVVELVMVMMFSTRKIASVRPSPPPLVTPQAKIRLTLCHQDYENSEVDDINVTT